MNKAQRVPLDDLTPKEIVAKLDKYIIGQSNAKRTIAVALRNRKRRKMLSPEMRDEVSPKNIIMIGSTGVGKTEIARRIARLFNAPFIKVEATKYTEVGYVGRDVESMVRDLASTALQSVKAELKQQNEDVIEKRVEDIILDALMKKRHYQGSEDAHEREEMRQSLRKGDFDDEEIELDASLFASQNANMEIGILGGGNMDDIQEAFANISSVLSSSAAPIFGRGKSKVRKLSVKRAYDILIESESEKIIDPEKARDIAAERVEQSGIIFIDEIDKIAGKENNTSQDVSREGVQRDILPIVEGTKVNTRCGVIDTTHILFIAAGAFHVSKPSDLIPELQGRFPLRVELDDLTSEDFYRILKEPENALLKQYKALLATEGVNIEFDDDGVRRISELAYKVNSTNENIGARRLHTIMENLLEEVSFSADELKGQTIRITGPYVDERLKKTIENQDLSNYIL